MSEGIILDPDKQDLFKKNVGGWPKYLSDRRLKHTDSIKQSEFNFSPKMIESNDFFDWPKSKVEVINKERNKM